MKELEIQADKQLDSQDAAALSRPEGQFEKLKVRRSTDNINMCMAVTLTYRYLEKGKRQEMVTNLMECRNLMMQAIREAKEVSKKERPLVFSKKYWSRQKVEDYHVYLDKLQVYYEEVITPRGWKEYKLEDPYCSRYTDLSISPMISLRDQRGFYDYQKIS